MRCVGGCVDWDQIRFKLSPMNSFLNYCVHNEVVS